MKKISIFFKLSLMYISVFIEHSVTNDLLLLPQLHIACHARSFLCNFVYFWVLHCSSTFSRASATKKFWPGNCVNLPVHTFRRPLYNINIFVKNSILISEPYLWRLNCLDHSFWTLYVAKPSQKLSEHWATFLTDVFGGLFNMLSIFLACQYHVVLVFFFKPVFVSMVKFSRNSLIIL